MSTVGILEYSLISKVEQIMAGRATCHCGAAAVFRVDGADQDEPGLVCHLHAMPWLDVTGGIPDEYFTPKEA